MSKPGALSPDEAKRKIAFFLKEGTIIPTSHCRESMRARNVTMQDIEHTLEDGEILKPPEWDDGHSHWKYRVEGTDFEGETLTCITVIIDVSVTLRIITVF